MLGLFGPKSGKIGVYKAAFIYQGPLKEDFSAGSPAINEVVLVTRCIMGSVFSDYQEGAAIFGTVSPTRRGGPSSQLAQSPCARDPKRSDRGRPSCHFRVLAVVPGSPPFL